LTAQSVEHTKAGSFDKKLTGIIEADETYIDGKLKNMHHKERVAKGYVRTGKLRLPGTVRREADRACDSGARWRCQAKIIEDHRGLGPKPAPRLHARERRAGREADDRHGRNPDD
jgi:hypothetical protein